MRRVRNHLIYVKDYFRYEICVFWTSGSHLTSVVLPLLGYCRSPNFLISSPLPSLSFDVSIAEGQMERIRDDGFSSSDLWDNSLSPHLRYCSSFRNTSKKERDSSPSRWRRDRWIDNSARKSPTSIRRSTDWREVRKSIWWVDPCLMIMLT